MPSNNINFHSKWKTNHSTGAKENPPKKFAASVLKPTYCIATIFGIAPKYDFATHRAHPKPCYSVVVLLIIAALFSATMAKKFDEYSRERYQTQIATHFLSALFSFLCSVTIVLSGGVVYARHFQTIFDNFDLVDGHMGAPNLKSSATIKQYLEIVLAFGFITIQAVYNFLVDYYRLERVNLSTVLRKPLVFVNMAACLLLRHLASQLAVRYKYINQMLKMQRHGTFGDVAGAMDKKAMVPDVGILYWAYLKLHETVVLYNRIFGWQILMICGHFIANMLFSVNALIIELSRHSGLNGYAWTNHLMHILMNLILCLPFVPTCQQVSTEAKYTSLLCYVQLSRIKSGKHQDDTTRWRSDLEQMAAVPWPGITAAGFYTVDNTMLYGLFGAMTSYLIVLIQLKDHVG